MSKDKAEEKAREEHKVQKWLLEKGLHNSVISTRFDKENIYVSDAIIDYAGSLSTENAQLREALREMVERLDAIHDRLDDDARHRKLEVEVLISKAKQLLTDNTKQDVKHDKQ